jgi:HAD superfamily hydrolase (TIGR01509 family)
MRPALAALLVELEGILVDTRAARRGALADALLAIGHALPDDQLAWAADGHAAARAASLAAALVPIDPTDEELTALRADRAFEERIARGLTLLPGAREALESLAGRMRILAVTRAPSRAAEQMLALGGLEACVSGVVAAEQALEPKPSPSGHARALERLARFGVTDPRAVVALEDAPDGVAAARAAGVHVIAVGGGARDATDADAWLASLAGVDYDAVVDLLETNRARGA